MAFYVLHHGWYMQNNSVAALSATSRSCGNIRWFGQNYQPGKITLPFSVLIIKYLVAVSFGWCYMCCIFGFNSCMEDIEVGKWYGGVVKGLNI